MSFSQTVESFCAHLQNAPQMEVEKKTTARKGPPPFDMSKIPLEPEAAQKIERALALTEQRDMPTAKETLEHMDKLNTFLQSTLETFGGLSCEDKCKLSAIAKAGISGGTVSGQYKYIPKHGSCVFTMASAAQMQKGLAKAKAEGLDLDAEWE